jgi:hypothetical protein
LVRRIHRDWPAHAQPLALILIALISSAVMAVAFGALGVALPCGLVILAGCRRTRP